ncbi:GNAT family N-acetyltransferase [Marinovum sp. 2_MG-2023]|uniref:GNAT family N-acetyltransferase n=1 Tax=Roseobacteraceae TaxID=2854170 RepID=UPI001FD5929B|nr:MULTISPECIES: GNAT family N-acetyltransferase [Roseobacteraceae]MCJ7872287.1 GNAT family N-acetyltransferase [Phaeobacter sp. J2-8]MDO6729443.1 GNAT family N-acetyltransferase [Marinovum sp. 2_MG-2023]MDO6781321.1 GNAT family N-acetyltransferase [Marinovum sp. 1_MG-2023]
MTAQDHIVTQPVIETERVDLRPLRRSDMGLIEMHAADERVARMTTSIPHPLPPGVTESFVTRAMVSDPDEVVWAMDGVRLDGPEVMGLISLDRMDRNQSEVGYWVAPAFWNTGLASDAVRALVEANPLDNDTMFASVFQDNPASARVLINCGFAYIGDAESYSVARGGQVPTWTYLRKLR